MLFCYSALNKLKDSSKAKQEELYNNMVDKLDDLNKKIEEHKKK
jgi:hypothetical protein